MSFEELLTRIKPKLRGIAVKLDGRYTSFNDDDLCQEALCVLWEKYQRGELSNKTDSYILQGCLFFLKNYIRKAYTRIDSLSMSLEKTVNENEDTLEDFVPAEESCPQVRRSGYLERDIRAYLDEREAVVLALYIRDFTTREIGCRLGISHVMVVKIIARIKVKCSALKEEIM
ncbi:MAG: sigma-70 family RNA polymerase sigma factor [Candidatus Omnitrophota bacterium]|nr:sigma-70 family RNA polymerase sigma factor [Candidatus Omnitrophota bacterium]